MNGDEDSKLVRDASTARLDHSPAKVFASLDSQLHDLYQAFSQKFAALAAILQENARLARLLATNSREASGGEAKARCKALIDTLRKMLGEVEEAGRIIAANTDEMGQIFGCVQRILAPLKNLAELPLQLKIIGVLTRIEGGSLLDREVNIEGLSQDIEGLAGDVAERVNHLLDGAEGLSSLLRRRLADLLRHVAAERAQAEDLGARIESFLKPSVARLSGLEAEAVRLDEKYRKFQRSTDDIVISLQSDDIARQRLEHIQEALRRTAAALASGETIPRIGAILELQRSQLESTRDVVDHALRTIHKGLEDSASVVQELIAQSAEQLRQAEASGQSCTSALTLEIPQMLEVFRQCSDSVRSVQELVESIHAPVASMTSGAAALGQVAYAVQLLSFNTSVKTVHLGDQGAPLGVLARALQTVIDESASDTDEVLRGLAFIADTLARMKQGDSWSQQLLLLCAVDEGGLGNLFASSVAEDTLCGESAARSKSSIDGWARALCQGIEQGVHLSFDARSVLCLFDDQLLKMDAAFAALGHVPGSIAGRDQSLQAAGLSGLYSMASERQVHDAVLGGNSGSMRPIESLQSEFGDSVELF